VRLCPLKLLSHLIFVSLFRVEFVSLQFTLTSIRRFLEMFRYGDLDKFNHESTTLPTLRMCE
jgi:hypothetical protein